MESHTEAERTSDPGSGRATSLGALLQDQLATQVAELLRQDPGARAGDEDAIHDLRVAARRLRALLATYRPVLDQAGSEPVRAELRWLGGEVGAARDAQVQHERLLRRLDALPRNLVRGPVRRRSRQELQARTRAGLGRLRAALDSGRYRRLLDALRDVAQHPPVTEDAAGPAGRLVPGLVDRQVRRVQKAAARTAAGSPPDREAALHDVRKAAKRARYAAESAAAVAGRPATRLAARMQELQDVLGEHQDAVTARELHRDLGAAAHAAGNDSFTFGVLCGQEDAAAAEARARYPRTLERATSGKAVGWTR